MWLFVHENAGTGRAVSIDFEKCLISMPSSGDEMDEMEDVEELGSDYLEECEEAYEEACDEACGEVFELLQMPLPSAIPDAPPPSPKRRGRPKPADPSETHPNSPTSPPPPPPSPILFQTAPPAVRERRRHTRTTDDAIVRWVETCGPTWRELARSLGGREKGWSDDVVRNRHIRLQLQRQGTTLSRKERDPNFRKPEHPITPWTRQEDALLIELMPSKNMGGRRRGVQWKDIALHFGAHRTPHAIRNRASRLGLQPGIWKKRRVTNVNLTFSSSLVATTTTSMPSSSFNSSSSSS